MRIRVANTGTQTLRNVVVTHPSGTTMEYGDIAPGGQTDYQMVDEAYPYAYVKATVDGVELEYQPIDYVGETPLEPGLHTYDVRSESRSGVRGLDVELNRE